MATETYKNLRFETSETETNGRTRFIVHAWRGKQSQPFAQYYFHSDAQRAAWIDERKASADAIEEIRAKRKADEVAAREALAEQINPGTLLAYSWGWEQTNVDFFQVVERRGRKITLRPIGGEMVDNPGGSSMSCFYRPVPDSFISENTMTKMIGAYGITMPHGVASVTSPDRKHYCSWYA